MSSEIRFAEIRKMLERQGWRMVRITGSHHIFEKPDFSIISVPVHHGKVMPKYVHKVEKILKSDRPSV